MLKGDVRNSIYNSLATILLPAGFKGNKREAIFVRKFEGGFQRIGIPLADYAPTFQFSVLASIRLDDIEMLSRKFSPVFPEFTETSISVVVGLGYLVGEETDFEVSSSEMLDASINSLNAIVQEKMLPLLAQCTNVEFANSMLNGPEGVLLQMDFKHRAFSGIAAAALCKDENFEALVTNYREIFSKNRYNEKTVTQFDDLVTYIRENYNN